MKNQFPIVTLSNGFKVANFSSAHKFKFEDGSILEAVSDEQSKRLSCEEEKIGIFIPMEHLKKIPVTINVTEYRITKELREAFNEIEKLGVDYILCPKIILQAMQDENYLDSDRRFRYVMATSNRQSKACSINEFSTLSKF